MKLLFIIRCVKSNIAGTPSHIFVMTVCRDSLPQLFVVGICRSYLSWEFTVDICRGNVLQLFAVGLFCVCKQTFFLFEQILFLLNLFYLKENVFYIWAKLYLFIRISLLTVFLFVIAVAVMGHRTCS